MYLVHDTAPAGGENGKISPPVMSSRTHLDGNRDAVLGHGLHHPGRSAVPQAADAAISVNLSQ